MGGMKIDKKKGFVTKKCIRGVFYKRTGKQESSRNFKHFE